MNWITCQIVEITNFILSPRHHPYDLGDLRTVAEAMRACAARIEREIDRRVKSHEFLATYTHKPPHHPGGAA